jgi:hypothetical protein
MATDNSAERGFASTSPSGDRRALLDSLHIAVAQERKTEFHPPYGLHQTPGGFLYASTRHQQTSQTCKVHVEFLSSELRLREAAARLFAEGDGIEREPGTPSSDPYKAAFDEIIAEKHRKMGLQL